MISRDSQKPKAKSDGEVRKGRLFTVEEVILFCTGKEVQEEERTQLLHHSVSVCGCCQNMDFPES